MNEQDEFEMEKHMKKESETIKHRSACLDVSRIANLSRTFIMIAVQPNGDLSTIVHGEAYSDFVAIATCGSECMTSRLAAFKRKSLDAVQ